MKKLFLSTLLLFGLAQLHSQDMIYSLQSVSGGNININVNSTCSPIHPTIETQFSNTVYVYLEQSGSLFYCGEFYTKGSSCSTSPPNYNSYALWPICYPGGTMTPACDGVTTRTATVSLPSGCVPSATYNIRLYVTQGCCPSSFPSNPYAGIQVGSTTQLVTASMGNYLVVGDIGTTAVTGGSSFTASVSSTNVSCSSFGSITFNMSGTAPYTMGTGIMYGFGPGISTQTTSSGSYTYNGLVAGTYYTYVKDATGCRRDFIITISPPSMPTVSASKNPTQPPAGYCKNTCITLNATPSTGTGYTYSWTRNGTAISSNQSFCNKPGPTPITTTFVVTISNTYGCTASGSVTAVTDPSCLGSLNACCSNIGHRIPAPDDTAYVAVQLFPNPASDVVNVQFTEPAAYGTVLEFTDITGKVVRHVEVPEGAECYTMDVSDLPAGVYLANIIDQDTQIISTEFVIE